MRRVRLRVGLKLDLSHLPIAPLSLRSFKFVTMDVRNLLQNLEELVTCQRCFNVIRNPKLTPCLHTFCCECLNDIARSRPHQTYIACPQCQCEIRKPLGDQFEALPSNFYTGRLLDLLAAKRRSHPDVACGNCKKKVILSAFCFACDSFMCEGCLSAHNNALSRGDAHRITVLGQFKQRDYEDLLRRRSFCGHKFKERGNVEYFCFDCDTAVCHICNIAIQHSHRIVDIHDAANEQKLKFREANMKLREKMQAMETGVHNIEHRIMEVQEHSEYLKNDITDKMDKLVAIIRSHQSEMLRQLENIRKDKHENLTCQLQMYETMLTQTRASFTFIEELLQRNISEEILTVKNHVFKQAGELGKIVVGTTPAENERVGYVPNSELFGSLQSSALGEVVTSLTEPSMCSSYGDGVTDVSAGEEATFVITTRNAQGEVSYSDIDHVIVEVKSSMWGLVETVVKNYKNGTYDVSYVPRVPGPHKVQVEVGGNLIQGSPFTVDVKHPILTPVKSFGSHSQGDGKFAQPHGLAAARSGEIVVSDSLKHHIYVLNADGTVIRDFGREGTGDGHLFHPMSVAFDNSEQHVLVADSDNNRIQVFDVKSGKLVRKFGKEGTGTGLFNGPCGVAVDARDRIIVTDWNNHRIQVFSPQGRFLFEFGENGDDRLIHPRNAIFHESAECFVVSDTGNDVIKVYDREGELLRVIGRPGKNKGEFCGPRGLAVDRNGHLIVCDFENHRLQFLRLDGTVVNTFGTNGKGIGQFAFPMSVSVMGDSRVVVSDWGNNRIQIFKCRDLDG